MSQIASLLPPERIRLNLDAGSKGRVFEEAGVLFAQASGLDPGRIVESLTAREKMASTGLGQGVALPHARIKGLKVPLAAFLSLRLPIAFDAPDGKPVSLLLVLLVPEQANETHLQLLAEIAQMFCDRHFRDQLREQTRAEDVLRAFAAWSAHVV